MRIPTKVSNWMPGIFFKRLEPEILTGTLLEFASGTVNSTNFYRSLLIDESNPAGIKLTPHFEPPEEVKEIEKQSSDITARNFRPIPVGRGKVSKLQ